MKKKKFYNILCVFAVVVILAFIGIIYAGLNVNFNQVNISDFTNSYVDEHTIWCSKVQEEGSIIGPGYYITGDTCSNYTFDQFDVSINDFFINTKIKVDYIEYSIYVVVDSSSIILTEGESNISLSLFETNFYAINKPEYFLINMKVMYNNGTEQTLQIRGEIDRETVFE